MPETPKEQEASPLQLELARKVLARMRDAALPVGARVSAPELAAAFGVSRSPIGRALDILAEAGLLAPGPKRGLCVARDLAGVKLDEMLPASPLDRLHREIMRDRALGRLPREVSEAELIPRYGASRGAVRKILMRFAAEGLAHRLPGHGWRFADSLDDDEAYRESYEFRLIVECAALTAPGFRVDAQRAASIRRAHSLVLDQPDAVSGGEEWFRINAEFHESLAGFSGNRFLADAVRQQNALRRMQEAAAFEELPADRILQSCREHLDILDAAEAGDGEWAAALLRRHIREAADYRWPKADEPDGDPEVRDGVT